MSCLLLFGQQAVYAQDKGEPALKDLTYYTAIGSIGGIALGLAVIMLDPLHPAADIELSVYTGMAIGTIGGFVFGCMQLSRQMILPYEEPEMLLDESDLGISLHPALKEPEMDYAAALERKPRDGVPLVRLGFKF
jgi:hypothetical protein